MERATPMKVLDATGLVKRYKRTTAVSGVWLARLTCYA
jgi:hypothetical protein